MARHTILLVLAASGLAAGCSATTQLAGHYNEVAPVARVIPQRDHTQITTASWYGPRFNGLHTATGEVFHQNDLTAASKTLPLGSRVRVTNVANGRSVVVRINDRGPFVRGRNLDLSRGAAQRLRMIGAGTGKVRISRVAYQPGSAELASRLSDGESDNQWPAARRSQSLGSESHWSFQPRLYHRHYKHRRRTRRPVIVADPIGDAILAAFSSH